MTHPAMPGAMLAKLHQVELELPALLAQGVDAWQSSDVDLGAPHVERLWRAWGAGRICLHRLHPCTWASLHAHPWRSAIRLLAGRYEMGLAWGDPHADPVQRSSVARVELAAGSRYEMIEPFAWHSVRPLELCHSVMVTGRPFADTDPDFDRQLPELAPAVKADLHRTFVQGLSS